MLETARLIIIPVEEKHFEAVLQSEQKLAGLLGVELANEWIQFPEAMPFGYEMLKAKPENRHWGMYFFIHKTDKKLIGNGGFKGAADKNGMVEIGYAFSPEYWNQGLASETVARLMRYAFSYEFIKTVDAHTLAEENASARVLQKSGMVKIAEKHDAEDGDIWQWRITRAEFENLDR